METLVNIHAARSGPNCIGRVPSSCAFAETPNTKGIAPPMQPHYAFTPLAYTVSSQRFSALPRLDAAVWSFIIAHPSPELSHCAINCFKLLLTAVHGREDIASAEHQLLELGDRFHCVDLPATSTAALDHSGGMCSAAPAPLLPSVSYSTPGIRVLVTPSSPLQPRRTDTSQAVDKLQPLVHSLLDQDAGQSARPACCPCTLVRTFCREFTRVSRARID